MKLLKYLGLSLITFYLLLLCSCSTNSMGKVYHQPGKGMPSKPGACYSKAYIPDYYAVTEKTQYIYTGDNPNQEGIEVKRTETGGGTRWEKKKADRNCLAPNPEDCLVWCLVDVPVEIHEHVVVTDTSLVKDFEVVTTSGPELIHKRGFFDWVEVTCQKDVTQKLISEIQARLISMDYDTDNLDPTGKLDRGTKDAIVAFQSDLLLPKGGLNLVTLGALGIEKYKVHYQQYIM